MTEDRKNTLNIGRKIGALVGGIIFAVFGIVPGFYFGSYGTLVLLSHLMGGPVEAGIIVRMLTVVGIIMGLFCTAAVSIIIGAVTGTALAYAADVVRMPIRAAEKAAVTE